MREIVTCTDDGRVQSGPASDAVRRDLRFEQLRVGKTGIVIITPMNATGTLHDGEAELARMMAADRQREFTVGRIAAREALRAAGAPEVAVGMGTAGEPRWPATWVGSLSHCRTHAVALVASTSEYLSVGVDLDDARPLGDEAASDLMTANEVRGTIEAGIATDIESARRFVFSAKEAVFKCQYGLTGNSDLDFPDVDLVPTRGLGSADRLIVYWRPGLRSSQKPDIEVFPLINHSLVLAVAVAPCTGRSPSV